MKRVVAGVGFALAASLHPVLGEAAGPACPIEQVVGQIQWIDGDRRAVHLYRNGQSIPITSQHMCLLYGDKIESGLQATVAIDIGKSIRHVGGNWDTEWAAPQPRETASPDASAALNTLFHSLFGPTQYQSSPAIGRAGDACPPLEHSLGPLIPLDRLRQANQRIGADLRGLAVGWTPLHEPQDVRDVQARLLRADGVPVVQERTCVQTHVFLQLPPVSLRPGDHLTLELRDDYGGNFRYTLSVVEPDKLPRPPFEVEADWQLGAWRIAAAPGESHLDAISRLQTAPADSLGARRILEAVWTEAPF